MKALLRHELKNPLRLVVKAVSLSLLIAVIAHAAYVQGIRHAILTAQVWSDGSSYLLAVDGEVHEYH